MSVDVVESLFSKKEKLQNLHNLAHFVFVTSSNLSEGARNRAQRFGIEVWDGLKLAALTSEDLAAVYFGRSVNTHAIALKDDPKADSLTEALPKMPPGTKQGYRQARRI